ncbi:MAG: hypothetical protein MUF16_03185 [Burkholderiaceae bacterium]|nr:hypothetical protein [Burkholderiaceae bacterium]
MTAQDIPEQFDRVMGCTVQELTAWLPVALPQAELKVDLSACRAEARFPDGALTLSWQVKAARRIALLAIPQLGVSFQYVGLGDDRRREIQRRFDLATQRGGG